VTLVYSGFQVGVRMVVLPKDVTGAEIVGSICKSTVDF